MLADRVRLDAMPVVIRRVEPELPDHERGASEALVVVRARVGRDGSVSDASIARSVPPLDAAALRAVRQWRFRPARYMGRPLAVSVYVPVRFAGP